MEKFYENQIQRILLMEYLGIQIDDIREVPSPKDMTTQTCYYFSVPESSTLIIDGFASDISSADSLKKIAKEQLMEMYDDAIDSIVEADKELFADDENWREELRSKCIFYAKVRTGEVWDKDKAEEAVRELSAAIKEANGYEEI